MHNKSVIKEMKPEVCSCFKRRAKTGLKAKLNAGADAAIRYARPKGKTIRTFTHMSLAGDVQHFPGKKVLSGDNNYIKLN